MNEEDKIVDDLGPIYSYLPKKPDDFHWKAIELEEVNGYLEIKIKYY